MKDNPKGSGKPDFSDAAARRAALTEFTQHPLTLWPPAIGVAAGFGLTLFTMVSMPAAVGIAAGGVCIGAVHLALKFFGGSDAYTQKYYAKLHEEFEEHKRNKSAELAKDLKRLGSKQGQEQVTQFEEKFQNLLEVFRRVLSENELTFSRFVGTAEQVYRLGFENLERIVTLLINVDDIDRPQLEKRILTLERKIKRTSADDVSLSALRNQAGVYDQTLLEVEELLAKNEQALATMDQAGRAALKIKDRSASQTSAESMAEAMELLGQMIARANSPKNSGILLEQDKQSQQQP